MQNVRKQCNEFKNIANTQRHNENIQSKSVQDRVAKEMLNFPLTFSHWIWSNNSNKLKREKLVQAEWKIVQLEAY